MGASFSVKNVQHYKGIFKAKIGNSTILAWRWKKKLWIRLEIILSKYWDVGSLKIKIQLIIKLQSSTIATIHSTFIELRYVFEALLLTPHHSITRKKWKKTRLVTKLENSAIDMTRHDDWFSQRAMYIHWSYHRIWHVTAVFTPTVWFPENPTRSW